MAAVGLAKHLRKRRVLVSGAVALAAALAIVLILADPFGGSSSVSQLDNGAPTATATVERQDLSSQTQVSATLGYGDPSTVSVASGTAPSSLEQAQQSLADDLRTLTQAQASLDAELRKTAVDCRGASAGQAGGGSTGQASGSTGQSSSPCASDAQALTADRQSVASASSKVQTDRSSLAEDEPTAAIYGPGAVYTMLPAVGQIVRSGEPLYAIDGHPALLLYGDVPVSRAFLPGMPPGADVAELNRSLRRYGAPSGDVFTLATARAIEALQAAHHLPPTGQLLIGSVVFEPSAVRVTSVTPTSGGAVQAGPLLGITSTRRVVTIALDASQQTSVKVGDPVSITLPDNSTTQGHVSFVGTVATAPSSSQNGNGGSNPPTIEVDVTPDHPAATGGLDQAPVDVSITTASVSNVLVVPVNALLALANGGYAVEVVDAHGVHQLQPVKVGLFDDAAGLVQVSGGSLAAGQHVVVPAS